MKVLLAEDDAVTRKVLRAALTMAGYQVAEAADGRQAWELFDREPVRLVVSDWNMPGLDGLELCRKIRERPGTDYAYLILITGGDAGKDRTLDALKKGVDDFLAKPLDPDMIKVRLRVAERILSLGSRLKELEDILTLCAYCKRIRSDSDAYQQLEAYIERHSHSVFSHGICPDCEAKHFPPAGLAR